MNCHLENEFNLHEDDLAWILFGILSVTVVSTGEHQRLQDIRQRDDAFHHFLLIHDHEPVNLRTRQIPQYLYMQLFLSYCPPKYSCLIKDLIYQNLKTCMLISGSCMNFKMELISRGFEPFVCAIFVIILLNVSVSTMIAPEIVIIIINID